MTDSSTTMGKDFLSIRDLDAGGLMRLIDLALQLKKERVLRLKASTASPLSGRHVALLFEKPSLRTRSTFQIAVRELGGDILDVPADMAGTREPLEDVARNLERWVDALVVRTFAQEKAARLAAAARRMHVINALTDQEHPCQALADFVTLRERWGSFRGRRIAYIGDGNNVAASLAQAAARLGVSVSFASPQGYELPASVLEEAGRAARNGAELRQVTDPVAAVRGADAVYTDVWTSMGQEDTSASRRLAFANFQVNERLMALAADDALFMHCLPAHRGEEVTAAVLESDASIVFEQAENRLHAQKALLLQLLA